MLRQLESPPIDPPKQGLTVERTAEPSKGRVSQHGAMHPL